MKPWAERSAGERAGVVAGIVAAVIALLFGVWKIGPGSAPPATDSAETAPEAAPAAPEPAAPEPAASAEAAPEPAAPEPAAPAEAAPAEPTAEAATDEAATPDAAEVAEDAAADAGQADAPAAPEDAAAADAATAAAAEDATAAAGATEPAAEAVADPAAEPAAAEPAQDVPVFDLVRVTSDGSAVFAGSGAPGATILLRLDGAEIGTVPADAQGNFVALFNLPPSDAPRVLTLAMRLADGTEVAAAGRVVIAPTVAPAPVVAVDGGETADPAAEPAAEPAPEEAPAQPPAALLVTDEGARVLQSGQDLSAAMAANVTVDAITYTPEGDVQFAGRGTGGAVVRLYLDNAQIADAVVDGQGAWGLTMPGIDPGLYTLRVDQIDAEGKVTSRFETPFQRETMEALAAAAEQAAAEVAEAAAPEPAAEADAEAGAGTAVAEGTAPDQPVSITVQPGFTLWRIARENLGDGVLYVQVFEANKDQIRNPDLIYPGQVFAIPQGD